MTDPALSIKTNNGRYYVHPKRNQSVPSVTNIKDVKHVPLDKWAAKLCARYSSQNREKLAGLNENEVFQLVRNAPWAPENREASRIGDVVHGWIDDYIKGAPPQPVDVEQEVRNAQDMWFQFGGFVDKYRPEFIDAEFTVWSDKYGYAGTADWAARIANLLVLGDTKTGSYIYPDVGFQLAALSKADFILRTDGTEHPMPHWDKLAVLHVRPRFVQLVPIDHVEECFQAFLGLKAVFDHDVLYSDKVLIKVPKIERRKTAA